MVVDCCGEDWGCVEVGGWEGESEVEVVVEEVGGGGEGLDALDNADFVFVLRLEAAF